MGNRRKATLSTARDITKELQDRWEKIRWFFYALIPSLGLGGIVLLAGLCISYQLQNENILRVASLVALLSWIFCQFLLELRLRVHREYYRLKNWGYPVTSIFAWLISMEYKSGNITKGLNHYREGIAGFGGTRVSRIQIGSDKADLVGPSFFTKDKRTGLLVAFPDDSKLPVLVYRYGAWDPFWSIGILWQIYRNARRINTDNGL